MDDGDIYDEAVDVRELHKNDENLIDGWTTENPAERDRRIEKHMEEHGRILDGNDKNRK